MRLYISDIKSLADAKKAIEWGASAIGIKIGYGNERVHDEKAREIFMEIPLFVSRVGIVADEKRYHIQELVTFCRLDTVHFVGNESPQDCKEFHEHLIKSFSVQDLEHVGEYDVAAVVLHMESISTLDKIDLQDGKLLILSGSLTIDEWSKAITRLRPYAIQLSMPEINEELVNTLKSL